MTPNFHSNSSSLKKTGYFITFEGMDGVGKTTQVQRFVNWWQSQGMQVISLREPGGTGLCEKIRTLIKEKDPDEQVCDTTEALLINAARAQLTQQVILPALQSGTHVVCDRFYDSTIAYQCYGRGLPRSQVESLIHFATAGLKPDCTIYYEAPEASRLARMQARENKLNTPDRFELESCDFFQRVEEGFKMIALSEPERFRVISAVGSIDEVFEKTQALLKALFPNILGAI